jgi:hypothetical protein
VDDGSTDGTSDLLRATTDLTLRVIRTEGVGLGAARNLALGAASAPLLAVDTHSSGTTTTNLNTSPNQTLSFPCRPTGARSSRPLGPTTQPQGPSKTGTSGSGRFRLDSGLGISLRRAVSTDFALGASRPTGSN